MQVNKFISYVNRDEHLMNASQDELLPLVKEFPYCQTGQLMYAVHLHATGNIGFEEQLRKTAAYAAEREQLFQLIHPTIDEEKAIEDPKQEQLEETDTLKVAQQTDHVNAEIEKDKVQDDELATLEKEYLTQAISSSILIESEQEVKNLESDSIEDTTKDIEEVNLFDEQQEHSFTDWLKHFNGEEVESNSETISQKKVNINLIDKFIQEDPRIEPNKTTFYSPTNMARKSVTDDGMVSETLAVIHMDQGNYEEAIRTYEKLILNNPKKRSYFASQIKILKQKLKQ